MTLIANVSQACYGRRVYVAHTDAQCVDECCKLQAGFPAAERRDGALGAEIEVRRHGACHLVDIAHVAHLTIHKFTFSDNIRRTVCTYPRFVKKSGRAPSY